MSLCFRRPTLLHWMKTSEKSTVKTQKIIARTTINVCVYWHLHMLLAILWGLQNHFSVLISIWSLPVSPFYCWNFCQNSKAQFCHKTSSDMKNRCVTWNRLFAEHSLVSLRKCVKTFKIDWNWALHISFKIDLSIINL